MVKLSNADLPGRSKPESPSQLCDDLKLLKKVWSAKPAALGEETVEIEALSRTCMFLETLGRLLVNSLGAPGAFKYQTNCKLCLEDVPRARIPGRLWVRISAADEARSLPAAPYLYLALSANTCEFGFSATAASDDPETKALQRWIRDSAPDVFDILRRQRSAKGKHRTTDWTFGRNDKPILSNVRSPNVNEWLSFRQAIGDYKNRSIAIARCLPVDAIESIQLSEEMIAAASLFRPLLSPGVSQRVAEDAVADDLRAQAAGQTNQDSGPADITGAFSEFVATMSRQTSAYYIDQVLDKNVKILAARIASVAEGVYGHTIRVAIDVGRTEWARTPWISIFDERMRERSDRAIYAGLLLSEDFSEVSFMLYYGMRYSVTRYGGRTSVAAMHKSHRRLRENLNSMTDHGFEIESTRHLTSEAEFESIYENATIARRSIPIEALNADDHWSDPLGVILDGYSRLSESI